MKYIETIQKQCAFVLFVCVLLIFSACGRSASNVAEEAAATVEQSVELTNVEGQAGSPLANAQANSPLAEQADSPLPSGDTPASAAALPEVERPEPVTSATTGAVVGQILVTGDGNVRPAAGIYAALAKVLRDDDGTPRVAGYNAAAAPREQILEDGSFVISDVPTGTYGLILDAAITSVLLNNPGTERSILIDVEADGVTDIGTLEYPSLNLPGLTE